MSDYETTQKKRNVIVGVFVVIGMCSLVWLIFKFGDLPVFVSRWKSFEVRVQFPTAPGVQENTPVRFCGYQIGRVVNIKPPTILRNLKTDRWSYQTIAVINIDKEYDNVIPEDVEVKLMTRGLGSSYIEFKTRPFDVKEPQGKSLVEGSLLQGSTGMTSEFFPEESQKKLEELVDGLRTFINNANDILGDKANKENFKTTLANMTEVTKQATKALKEFQELSTTGTATLKNADVRIEKFVTAMTGASEELSKTVAELRLILEKVNNGQGSLARLMNDGRLYENLLENSRQLQVLLQELSSFIAKSNDEGLPIKLK
ncbi:MAG TPA: MCE family protein [Phycisphaerales bacterium]|nr:MCE family protein [Phycisphaerales bacterium]